MRTVKVGVPGHVAELDGILAAGRQARWCSEDLHTEIAEDNHGANRHEANSRW